MGYKEAFDRSVGRTLKGWKKNGIPIVNRFKGSNLGQFLGAKGFKGKAKFLGNKIKNSNAVTRLMNTMKKIFGKFKSVTKFIISNAYAILISSSGIILTGVAVIFIISFTQALGTSPHYYCDLKPNDATKDTELYKRYCQNNYDRILLSTMNGHYIVQDGNGPGEACAVHNMLLRFWYLNGFNWYDMLWGKDGQYPIDSDYKMSYYNGAKTIREYVIGGQLQSGKQTKAGPHSEGMIGSTTFAKLHKSNYTGANWGYVRDESIKIADGKEKYKDLASNSKWVWDLSAKSDTSWIVNNLSTMTPTGLYASKGNEIKIVKETKVWENAQELVDILYGNLGNKKHAEGIVAVPYSGEPILVTGYDVERDCFTVIDSTLGMLGGFEGPITKKTFSRGIGITNEVLCNPKGYIKYYYYINPTFESGALATNGFITVGNIDGSPYPGMLYFEHDTKIKYNAPSSPYAEAIIEYAKAAYTTEDVWYKMGTPSYRSDHFDGDVDELGQYKEYDCSGLVGAAVKWASKGEKNWLHGATSQYKNYGVAIPLEEIEPGDLIYFSDNYGRTAHHCGIYVGKYEGDYKFIHAKGKDYGLKAESFDKAKDICCVIRVL